MRLKLGFWEGFRRRRGLVGMVFFSMVNGGLVIWAGMWLDVKDKWLLEGIYRVVDGRNWVVGF